MKKKLLAIILSVVMLVALFVPIMSISAAATPTVNLYLGTPVLTEDNIKIEVFMSGNNAEMCAINYKVYSVEKLTPVTAESGTVADSYFDGTDDVPITFDAYGTKFENPADFDGYTGFQILNDSNCEATLAAGVKTAEGKIAEVYFAAPTTSGTYSFKLVAIDGAAFVEGDTTGEEVQDYVITVGDDVAYNHVAPAAEATLSTSCYTMTTNSTAFFDNYGWGDNHLTTATAAGLAFDGNNSAELSVGAAAYDRNITGGALLSASKAGLNLTDANNTTTQTDAYLQMEFTLANAISNPTDILYINHYKKGQASIMSKHYAVFASATADELYTAPVFEYTLADGEDPSNIHVIDISSLNLQKVKYVAIRFYHRGYSSTVQSVEEFGLFGGEVVAEQPEAKVTYLSDKTLPTDLGTNHFAGSSVAVSETGKSAYAGNNATRWETVINTNEAQTFYGAKNTSSTILKEENNTVGQTEYYLQMTVTLPETVNNPTTFHYASNLAASTNAQLSDYYEIFASSKESDLYESKNSLGIVATDDTTTRQHKVDISEYELPEVNYFGIRFYHRPYSNYGIQITSIGLYGGEVATEEEESQITLEASVFDSKQGVNANDIMYKVDTSAVTGEITDMGIISGFKMNIDADDAFADDYAAFLKANSSESIVKVSAPASVLDADNLFFHIHNSGTHNGNDYSGYIVATIAYVTVMENGTPTTYYSNVITKSSMQISRNQAKALKEGGKVVEGYEGYDFANDGTIDIAKVREFVEA